MKHIETLLRSMFVVIVLIMTAQILGCASGPQEPDMIVKKEKIVNKITTTIFGRILDESRNPIQDAAVTCEGITVRTDELGYFLFRKISVPEDRCFVIAKKDGYFNASRATTPNKDDVTNMQLSMQSTMVSKQLNAQTGGTITTDGGAEITFAPASLRKEDGSLYTGTAQIIARYLSPDNKDFFDYFSGDYTGRTTNGDDVNLISCGVIRTLLRSATGEPLQLDPAKPAILSYPVPKSQIGAPSSMPLWYFDESIGMWKEDGSAALMGDMYVGTVTHFTDFNLDYKGDVGYLTFRVVCDQELVRGVTVRINNLISLFSEDGIFSIRNVPAGLPLRIEIRAEDNFGIYYLNTPVDFTITSGSTLDLGAIQLSSPCPSYFLTSIVNCDDKAVESMLRVYMGKETFAEYSLTGEFNVSAETKTPIHLYAVTEKGTISKALDQPLAAFEKRDIGSIKVCEEATANYFDIQTGSIGQSSINFSPDGRYLIAASALKKSMNLYESQTGRLITSIAIPVDGEQTDHRVQMSTNNTRILLTSNSRNLPTLVYQFDGRSITLLSSTKDVNEAKLYDDGSKFIGRVMGSGRSISVFNADDGRLIKTLNSAGIINFTDNITELIIDQSSNTLAVCGSGMDIRLFDVTADRLKSELPIESESNDITSNSDGSSFGYTSSLTNASIIVTTRTGEYYIFEGKPSMPASSRLAALGKTRVIMCETKENSRLLSIYHHQTRQLLEYLFLPEHDRMPSANVALSRDETRLAALGRDKIRVWRLK